MTIFSFVHLLQKSAYSTDKNAFKDIFCGIAFHLKFDFQSRELLLSCC